MTLRVALFLGCTVLVFPPEKPKETTFQPQDHGDQGETVLLDRYCTAKAPFLRHRRVAGGESAGPETTGHTLGLLGPNPAYISRALSNANLTAFL